MSSSSFFISDVFLDEVNDRLDNYLNNLFNIVSSTSLLNEDPDIIDIAETYIREWCRSEHIPFVLLRTAINIWRRNNSIFPGLNELVDFFNQNPCECSSDMTEEDRKSMIRICLVRSGNFPPCDFTIAFKMYLREYNAIPTYETVMSIINRMNTLLESSYFDEKVKVGTKNIEHLPTFTCKKDNEYDCSLCMDKISEGQLYHKLEPCGHHFHATESECIDSTIVKWLTENHTCPNCRKDVVIKEPESNYSDCMEEVD